jgi:AraC family transcriptional regulator, arabinose operon regulatory protein
MSVVWQVYRFAVPDRPWFWVEGLGHYRSGKDYRAEYSQDAMFLLFLTIAGEGLIRRDREQVRAPTGSVALVSPRNGHFAWSTLGDHWHFYWLQLWGPGPVQWAAQLGVDTNACVRVLPPRALQRLTASFEGIRRRHAAATLLDLPGAQREGFALYSDAVAEIIDADAPERAAEIGGRRVFAVIDEYLQRPDPGPDRVEDIARRLAISAEHLGRVVKAATGSTLKAWLIDRRMEQASRLLRSTDLSVAEVGRRVGYPDPFHFSRLFRQRLGETPTRYRRSGWG